MLVYHGTSERNVESILRDGLRPRGTEIGNWQHSVPSNSKAVYLTIAYAIHFAKACANAGERYAIFEVDLGKLDVNGKIAPDEDFLEQATRGDLRFSKCGTNINARTMWFRKRALSQFQHLWVTSFNRLGTGCYYGTIPPEALTRLALIPSGHVLSQMSDPSIHVTAYAIMGDFYRNLTKLAFGDVDSLEDDAYWDIVVKSLPDLSGIEVITL